MGLGLLPGIGGGGARFGSGVSASIPATGYGSVDFRMGNFGAGALVTAGTGAGASLSVADDDSRES